jgi:uncharacterized protein YukE
MSSVIKSTPQAIEAIIRMRSVINGGLLDQLSLLNQEGGVLSDPNNWDGPLARQFTDSWPSTHTQLMNTQQELVQLNAELDRIQQGIQAAGGA